MKQSLIFIYSYFSENYRSLIGPLNSSHDVSYRGSSSHFVAGVHFHKHWIICQSSQSSNLAVALFLKTSQGTTGKHLTN